MTQLWISLVQWLTTLSYKKISIFLLSLLVTLLGYSRWELKTENSELHIRVYNLTSANDSISNDSRQKVLECNQARREEAEKATNYWRERFEELEEKMYSQYRNIKKK